MKKAVAALVVIGVLSLGAVSYAHMWGGGFGWGGPGSMWGGMGYYPEAGYDKDYLKALDETADLRKALHEKKFEYREALRAGEIEKAKNIRKEIVELREKVYEKVGYAGGYGGCGGPGYGWR